MTAADARAVLPGELLQALRAERERVAALLAGLDQVIAAYGERPASPAPADGAPHPQAPKGPAVHLDGRRRAGAQRAGKLTARTAALDWAGARQLYEQGEAMTTIAARLHCAVATVRRQRDSEGWKEPGQATSPVPVPTKTPRRRCASCEQLTDADPCGVCGARWERTG